MDKFHAWIKPTNHPCEELVILDSHACEEYCDYAELICKEQYPATGQTVLDDATANQMIKRAGFERVTNWTVASIGGAAVVYYAELKRATGWPPGSIGEMRNADR